tara:strand:+ start:1929 stop:2102 length:174 start_codon:yes stop_codon:yes gene_type:complete
MNGYTPSYKSSDDIVMPKKNDTKIKPNEIFETSSNKNKKKPSVKKNEKKITKKKNKY